jgi:hypothetical protein
MTHVRRPQENNLEGQKEEHPKNARISKKNGTTPKKSDQAEN